MKESTQSSAATDTSSKNRLKFLSFLKFQHKELARERCDIDGVDRISELPDDILISIVSKLTLREAAATAVLSTRWRHLCSGSTRLIFPPFFPDAGPFFNLEDETFFDILEQVEEDRFPRYINMINHTLDSYQHGLELKEFRVHMHCLRGATIDRWLEFALSREVEIIDIQMRYLTNATHGYYTLGLLDLIAKKDNVRQPLPGLNTLKELSLDLVHVDDVEVELLLSTCPLLESLSIARSDRLKNVSIIGGSLASLKHLDISSSSHIESVEISDMSSLVSLRCYKLPPTYVLKLNNLPKLIEFTTTDRSENTLAQILSRIPCCILNQLRLLKLSTHTSFIGDALSIPELINVKHLDLEADMKPLSGPDEFFPLIEACRSLEKIEIKFLWVWIEEKKFAGRLWKWDPRKTWSRNLKTLKVSGYLGSPWELDFVSTIITNAVALKEIIVEPCNKVRISCDNEDDETFLRMATSRAWQQLRPITPISVLRENLFAQLS